MTRKRTGASRGGIAARNKSHSGSGRTRTSERLRATNASVSDNSRGDKLRRLKELRLEVNGHTCDGCGRCLLRTSYSGTIYGDHKVPVAQGGATTRGNVQVLCERCHENKTGSVNRRGRNLLKANAKRSNAMRRKSHESTKTKWGESWRNQ